MNHLVRFLALSLSFYCLVGRAAGVDARTQPKEFTGADGQVLRYRWAEKGSRDGAPVPLVVFLHGAGERGTDNAAQLRHGVRELLDWLDTREKGYRLIAAQVPKGKRWVEVDWSAPSHTLPAAPSETMGLLLEFLDRQLASGAVDCRRVYVTGISMGGYGTWDILCRRPGLFAAGLPICGGGDVAQAKTIARIPVWAFHGSADTAVPVCRSRAMMSALWKEGSNAHYREYPDAGHNVWTATYADKNVLGWFFRQRRR
jgi:predicted peptidase